MNEQIVVSIICNAYNHESYIAKCLDGFVMQKTNFKFEILIHDDASTDNTASIIRAYETQYPDLLKPIYQTENQYSKRGVARFQYPRVKGKYIAICEGDDYWTDPLKLQKQYEAMEAHPEVDICVHAAQRINEKTKKTSLIAPRRQNAVIPTEDVILGGGAYVATNSIFFRASIMDSMPPFRRMIDLDYIIQIHGSLRGGMLYLNDCMSVYRYMSPESWTVRTSQNIQQYETHRKRVRDVMYQLDCDTNEKYHDTIMQRLAMDDFLMNKRRENYKEMLKKKYYECMHQLPVTERIKIYVKAFFPILIKVKKLVDQARWG